MSPLSTLFRRIGAAILLGSLLVLAGCHLGGTKSLPLTAAQKAKFGVTVQAYKDGQFLLDGAVLSAVDLGSHFAYLKDQGRLPKRVLLESSDDSKIRKLHLQYMARLQIDYGFQVYYDDRGALTLISPSGTKARALQDYHKRTAAPEAPVQDHMGGSGY